MINIATWAWESCGQPTQKNNPVTCVSFYPYCYSRACVVLSQTPLCFALLTCMPLMPPRVTDTDLSLRTCWLVAVKKVERTELWQLSIWGIHPAFTSTDSSIRSKPWRPTSPACVSSNLISARGDAEAQGHISRTPLKSAPPVVNVPRSVASFKERVEHKDEWHVLVPAKHFSLF